MDIVREHDKTFTVVCPVCNKTRVLGYKAYRYVLTHNSKCRSCAKHDTYGLSLGRGWNRGICGEYSHSYGKKHTIETIEKLKAANLGRKMTPADKLKMRNIKLGKFGKLSNSWIGGKTEHRKLLVSRDNYKQLRRDVFKRDNWTCQSCGKRGGRIEMHHIKEWRNYENLRFEIDNCTTLCVDCHRKTDNFAFKARKVAI